MERQKQAKTIVPTSHEEFSISSTPESTAAPTLVPNPLTLSLSNSSTSLISGTQSSHPFLSPDGLALEGVVSSTQGQDMTQTGHFNQFIDMQNEISFALQGTIQSTLGTKHNPNPNNPHFVPNTIENNNFNGVNPALFNPNPVHARSGTEIGNPIEKFVTPQRPTLFLPHSSHISKSHVAWNSRSPQPFNTMQNQQVGHASGMQQMFDLQSQNPMRLEPYSNLEPVVATMPPNPAQQGYRSVLADPAAPSASILATTRNSFGHRSSMPPMYPPLYENQDHHHPQLMMPNGLGQQSGASLQQWSQGLPNQNSEYNQRMNTHNLQRESNTSSQASQSRILGHSSNGTIEGTSSQVFSTREAEIAPVSRAQPSEAIRRILDMNPTRLVTHAPTNNMQIGRIRYEPPRRGRPRKRRDDEEESSSQSGKKRSEPPRRGRPRKQRDDATESFSQRGKVSSKAQKAETTYASQQIPQQTPDSVMNTDQNAILTNTVYDMEFETKGIPPPPPPPGPSLVLNGSKASCGGVLRNCFGAWISGFLRNIGTTYVLSAELWGIFSTLDISWRVGHRRVLVECDSKVTAKLMSKGCLSSHPYSPLIHSIQRFFSRSWVLRVNHVYRKRNAVADSLAALAHSKPIGLDGGSRNEPLDSGSSNKLT
ncbi:hypothetical protein JHK87_014843 [Glycine soja]|nr:hypothetical protein JHK87_014843 [Glycine soja]